LTWNSGINVERERQRFLQRAEPGFVVPPALEPFPADRPSHLLGAGRVDRSWIVVETQTGLVERQADRGRALHTPFTQPLRADFPSLPFSHGGGFSREQFLGGLKRTGDKTMCLNAKRKVEDANEVKTLPMLTASVTAPAHWASYLINGDASPWVCLKPAYCGYGRPWVPQNRIRLSFGSFPISCTIDVVEVRFQEVAVDSPVVSRLGRTQLGRGK